MHRRKPELGRLNWVHVGPARFIAVQDEVELLLNSQKGPAASVTIPAVARCERASTGVVLRADVVARLGLRQVGRHHPIGHPEPHPSRRGLDADWPTFILRGDADSVLTLGFKGNAHRLLNSS